MDYHAMLAAKAPSVKPCGFAATIEDGILFPFQRAIVEWALGLGRAAIFADTGLGKTGMQLTWADRVAKQTGRPVILLAPLAVGSQTVREAAHFGIPDVRQVKDGSQAGPGINVTNYERLHLFDPAQFGGVVLDESSILKGEFGKVRTKLCTDWQTVPYRLACTATPAPNDHVELGNHSEFLGVLDRQVMMARWFVNDLGDTVAPWRLKGHAVTAFWEWVTSWARCVGRPSDVGPYDDSGYNLPPLNVHNVSVAVDITDGRSDGSLFRIPDISATGIHTEKRRTSNERAARAAEIATRDADPCIVWVDTNYDEEAIAALIPGAIVVSGSDTPERKAAKLMKFTDEGGVIITKPGIAGMGLNWQHCARMVFMGISFSYERYYQAVRRSWRFGQTRPVDVYVIMAPTEASAWNIVTRKAGDHGKMKEAMFAASRRAIENKTGMKGYNPTHFAPLPRWLHSMEIR